MQDQENRGKLLLNMPEGVKQYPMENGWLLVSPVGMCFIPKQEPKAIAPQAVPHKDAKYGKSK